MTYLKPFPAIAIADFRLKKKDTYDESDKYSDQFDLSQLKPEEQLDKLTDAVDQQLGVTDWVNVNTVITVAWSEWIELDYIVKRAIIKRTNEIIRNRQTKETKLKDDFEMKLASSASMNIKDISNTPIGRLMNR